MTSATSAPGATGMKLRTIGDPDENLARFLRRHDHTTDELLAQIGDAFGKLTLVVASGSVVLGYANQGSDLDLYGIGAVPDTQRVPLVSHELGPLVDILLLEEQQVTDDIRRVRQTPALLTAGGSLARDWQATKRILIQAIRLAYGVVLDATAEGEQTHAGLREPWLAERAWTWWQLEAARRLVTARWLAPRNARLAAQAAADARFAALKAVTARAGFLYLSAKWMSTELHAMGADDMLAEYRRALTIAWDTNTDVAETADVVDRLIGPAPEGLVIEVSYLPSVSVQPVGSGSLVSRWDLRGAMLPVSDLPPPRRGGRAIWTGGLAEQPPEMILELFMTGMVWMGVCDGVA